MISTRPIGAHDPSGCGTYEWNPQVVEAYIGKYKYSLSFRYDHVSSPLMFLIRVN